MPTKKLSGKRSTKSSAASAEGMTARGKGILKGLRDLADHLDGKKRLPVYHIPPAIDVRRLRAKTGLSQSEFAARFAIDVRTLQDWEQGRRRPDATVRAYLTVIGCNPEAVTDALGAQ